MTASATDMDLLTMPWIPLLWTNGASDEVSLIDALREAPRLSRIVDPSPLVALGIHRVLAAVLHTYLSPADAAAWGEIWDEGSFPEPFFAEVAARCAGRMRLFDAERPFYQSSGIPLSEKPAETLKNVGYLAPEASTGTNVTHLSFGHAGEARHAYCPVCCAKGLVQLPCFATAGGQGIKPGVNGVPPLYLLPRGENLFQTLMLNLLLPAYRGESALGPDPGPLWETEADIGAKEERGTTGFVEGLTWPPRRVRLFPEIGGECSRCGRGADRLVRRMVFSQGWSRPRELPLWIDGWVAYQRRAAKGSDPAEVLPIRPGDRRDIWRDFPALFLEQDDQGKRPWVLDQISGLRTDGVLPEKVTITYELFGLRTDMKAKIFEWRQETFRFPNRLLLGSYVAPTLREALATAEQVERALRDGLRELIKTRQLQTSDPMAETALRGYWLQLEGSFREKLFDDRLPGDEDARAAWQAEWNSIALAAAWREMERACESCDGTADQLLRGERARDAFRAALARKGGSRR